MRLREEIVPFAYPKNPRIIITQGYGTGDVWILANGALEVSLTTLTNAYTCLILTNNAFDLFVRNNHILFFFIEN